MIGLPVTHYVADYIIKLIAVDSYKTVTQSVDRGVDMDIALIAVVATSAYSP